MSAHVFCQVLILIACGVPTFVGGKCELRVYEERYVWPPFPTNVQNLMYWRWKLTRGLKKLVCVYVGLTRDSDVFSMCLPFDANDLFFFSSR